MSEFYLKPELIFEKAKNIEASFKKVLDMSSPFEIKGILNSEMLLFAALIDLLDVRHVIESGRARAQSTELIARWLSEKANNIRFDSIEFDKNSEDTVVAKKRVDSTGYSVGLHFGDAFRMLPELVGDNDSKKLVLIDGPKGIDALALAIETLKDKNVEAVCIHDMHKDATHIRGLIDNYWPSVFASDDKGFVDEFQYLDESCWQEHQKYKEFKGWGPYERAGKSRISYGPTLVCLFNDSTEKEYQEAAAVINKEKKSSDRKIKFIKFFGAMLPESMKKNRAVRRLVNLVFN